MMASKTLLTAKTICSPDINPETASSGFQSLCLSRLHTNNEQTEEARVLKNNHHTLQNEGQFKHFYSGTIIKFLPLDFLGVSNDFHETITISFNFFAFYLYISPTFKTRAHCQNKKIHFKITGLRFIF